MKKDPTSKAKCTREMAQLKPQSIFSTRDPFITLMRGVAYVEGGRKHSERRHGSLASPWGNTVERPIKGEMKQEEESSDPRSEGQSRNFPELHCSGAQICALRTCR